MTVERAARVVGISLLSLGLLLAGCGRVRRLQECRRLALVVNGGLDNIEREAGTGIITAADFYRVGASYERLAGEVATIRVESVALAREVNQYRSILDRVSEAARAAGNARSQGDERLVRARERELERLQQNHLISSQRIDGLCRAP